MITLHLTDTETLDIEELDSSYRYRSIMGKPTLYLQFALPTFVEIPIGTWCEFMGQRFVLRMAEDIKKQAVRNIEYSLTMYDRVDCMSDYKFRNSVDKRLKWTMTAKPIEFVEEIVKNLNQRDGEGVWKVGTCIESVEKTIEFNHSTIADALQDVADTFETEWEVGEDYSISVHKVEYFKDNPLPLSYGRGNGFIAGVGRTSEEEERPIKRLYCQGGDRNIDRSKYGNGELLLPRGQELEYEGRTYRSDNLGYYIERAGQTTNAVREESLDCSDIYPKRVGVVSSVECINAEKHFYDIIDTTIPNNLNYSNYIIGGETMTIIFQSGMLAGREFDCRYKHSERRIEIVPQEIDGVMMPNDVFTPTAGDKYAIFGIMLPEEYICNNETKEGGEWDMFREGAKYLYEHEEQKFTFVGTLQSLWAKQHWLVVGGQLKVGGYVLFTDNQFAREGVKIRIVGLKEYTTKPYSPTIELSNSVSGSSVYSQLQEIGQQEVLIDQNRKDIIAFTKRRFADVTNTITMLENAKLDFSNTITPIAVQTMAMLIGDESLQFAFIDTTTGQVVPCSIVYNQTTKRLYCPHSYIKHYTLGQLKAIRADISESECLIWQLGEREFPYMDDADKSYYLYAQVDAEDTDLVGQFILSETALDLEENGHYNLLVGILNKEIGGERSFVTLYGFTEILPSRVTTDRVVSANGENFFDLVANQFRIGGTNPYPSLDWSVTKPNQLTIMNADFEIIKDSETKILLNSDGSGVLASGNIEWNADGLLKAKDILVEGSFRSPIKRWENATLTDSEGFTYTRDRRFDSEEHYLFAGDPLLGWSRWDTTQDDIVIVMSDIESNVGGPLWSTYEGNTATPTLLSQTIAGIDYHNSFKGINGLGRCDNILIDENSVVGLNADGVSNIYANEFAWEADNSGRIIRLINTGDSFMIVPPTGKYFYTETGRQMSKLSNHNPLPLKINSQEIVVLFGYGVGSTFYGWIVLQRQPIGIDTKAKAVGYSTNFLAHGTMTLTQNTLIMNAKTYNGAKLTLSSNALGNYIISLPTSWNIKLPTDYIVLVTPMEVVDANNGYTIAVVGQTNTNFVICVQQTNSKVQQADSIKFAFAIIPTY